MPIFLRTPYGSSGVGAEANLDHPDLRERSDTAEAVYAFKELQEERRGCPHVTGEYAAYPCHAHSSYGEDSPINRTCVESGCA